MRLLIAVSLAVCPSRAQCECRVPCGTSVQQRCPSTVVHQAVGKGGKTRFQPRSGSVRSRRDEKGPSALRSGACLLGHAQRLPLVTRCCCCFWHEDGACCRCFCCQSAVPASYTGSLQLFLCLEYSSESFFFREMGYMMCFILKQDAQ